MNEQRRILVVDDIPQGQNQTVEIPQDQLAADGRAELD
jgi:hypothetical protein